MNFSVSNKRPCSYYQPEASLTQDSLQEKKKQHSELTPFAMCTPSQHRKHRQSLDRLQAPRGTLHAKRRGFSYPRDRYSVQGMASLSLHLI